MEEVEVVDYSSDSMSGDDIWVGSDGDATAGDFDQGSPVFW